MLLDPNVAAPKGEEVHRADGSPIPPDVPLPEPFQFSLGGGRGVNPTDDDGRWCGIGIPGGANVADEIPPGDSRPEAKAERASADARSPPLTPCEPRRAKPNLEPLLENSSPDGGGDDDPE